MTSDTVNAADEHLKYLHDNLDFESTDKIDAAFRLGFLTGASWERNRNVDIKQSKLAHNIATARLDVIGTQGCKATTEVTKNVIKT